jgi:hypothetical protein
VEVVSETATALRNCQERFENEKIALNQRIEELEQQAADNPGCNHMH